MVPGLACALTVWLVTTSGPTSGTTGPPGGGQAHPAAIATAAAASRAPRLVFGIYPGGVAGTVGPGGPTNPENPARRLDTLKQLRPAHEPFVLHLYVLYTGPGGDSAQRQIGTQLAAYGREGFQTELVLCYRPADGGSAAAVRGFVGFVRGAIRSLGATPGFTSLQVTNEANVGGAPSTSDGSYRDASEALIQGVIAAHAAIRQRRLRHLVVGFNWADATDPAQRTFWSELGRRGGRRFVAALNWIGLDAYPGTWGPQLNGEGLAAATQSFMDDALHRLRFTYLPLAGIPRRVPLHVSENGYPTGPGRTPAMQATVLRSAVEAVYRARGTDNVDAYRWFDLRDADSSSTSIQSQYGLLRDDYTPKPAFGVYRRLVAELSR